MTKCERMGKTNAELQSEVTVWKAGKAASDAEGARLQGEVTLLTARVAQLTQELAAAAAPTCVSLSPSSMFCCVEWLCGCSPFRVTFCETVPFVIAFLCGCRGQAWGRMV